MWLSDAKDIVIALSAATGAFIAWAGLSTWKRQMSGSVDHDLAKRFLVAVYALREAILVVRNPFMPLPEKPDLPEAELESMPAAEIQWHRKVDYYARVWRGIQDANATLEAVVFEAEALWGDGFIDSVNSIRKHVGTLYGAIQLSLELSNPNGCRPELTKEEHVENLLTVLGTGANDRYHEDLASRIARVERMIRPNLIRQPVRGRHCEE